MRPPGSRSFNPLGYHEQVFKTKPQAEASLAAEVLIDAPALDPGSGPAASFTRNSVISVARLFVSTLVALVLPAYLTRKLPLLTYSAWVLILQMSAYVGYLEFGIQSGISKYVAEFHARRDLHGAAQRASAGLALMAAMSLAGIVLTLILAWRVPQLFHAIPPAAYRDVRLSLIFVGTSLSAALLSSIFSAIFMGLQQYGVPTVLSLVNRLLYSSVILAAVSARSSLATMGLLVAAVNLLTGGLQYFAWKRMRDRIHESLRGLDRQIVRTMLGYCSSLAVWSVGMLCVSGLDLTIVGRYDFPQTAYYSIAVLPTNFMLALLGAALAPLMPAASALSVHKTPAEMGRCSPVTPATRPFCSCFAACPCWSAERVFCGFGLVPFMPFIPSRTCDSSFSAI